ncbi:MAG: iron-sulfur cluster assembly scaffold protein [Deltaproteobacteria bacterium]|nr:iron-sulfur cluster assembly scaffold protein [Deltaproteobacteria bacterium]
MDEKVVQYYRKITREGYRYSGSLENPSIFIDSVGEKIPLCSNSVNAYVRIYVKIQEEIIEDVKYLCTCKPTANVVAEIFCSLIIGKSIAELEKLNEQAFADSLGTSDEEYLEASGNIIKLLQIGLEKYKS